MGHQRQHALRPTRDGAAGFTPPRSAVVACGPAVAMMALAACAPPAAHSPPPPPPGAVKSVYEGPFDPTIAAAHAGVVDRMKREGFRDVDDVQVWSVPATTSFGAVRAHYDRALSGWRRDGPPQDGLHADSAAWTAGGRAFTAALLRQSPDGPVPSKLLVAVSLHR